MLFLARQQKTLKFIQFFLIASKIEKSIPLKWIAISLFTSEEWNGDRMPEWTWSKPLSDPTAEEIHSFFSFSCREVLKISKPWNFKSAWKPFKYIITSKKINKDNQNSPSSNVIEFTCQFLIQMKGFILRKLRNSINFRYQIKINRNLLNKPTIEKEIWEVNTKIIKTIEITKILNILMPNNIHKIVTWQLENWKNCLGWKLTKTRLFYSKELDKKLSPLTE